MEKKLEDLLSFCSNIDFGTVHLSNKKKGFCHELNNEIMFLCNSLPTTTQTDALLFLMRHLNTSFGQELAFFRYYYTPTWSIIYWLIQALNEKRLEQEDVKNAKTGHSMSMLLHALDDHLIDGEIPVTHLALLLRSQSWMIMNNALKNLADDIEGGEKIIQCFIDDYYSSIGSSKEIESLDEYCELFRKQMGIGFIVPVLITKKTTTDEKLCSAIQTAYGSFGIAWRLLDDIKDIKIDIMKGIHSSVYICLSDNAKNYWDIYNKEQNGDCAKVIVNYILKNGVINKIVKRICGELGLAASIASDSNMIGWADEFRCLLAPLKNSQDL
jgi:hypothetical protein